MVITVVRAVNSAAKTSRCSFYQSCFSTPRFDAGPDHDQKFLHFCLTYSLIETGMKERFKLIYFTRPDRGGIKC